MKIGIVTFWQTRDNYGQMLQCYALQQALIAMGHFPFLIRYLHSEHKPSWHDRLVYALTNIIHLRWSRIWLKRKRLPSMTDKDVIREFDTFKKERLSMSPQIYQSYSELKKSPPEADCYITGSDQVWSRSLIYDDGKVFFLDFGNKDVLRLSYAASYSRSSYPSRRKPLLKKMLQQFDSVSVREETGQRICDDVGIKSVWTCDPTILLTGDEYRTKFGLSNVPKQQIYIYSLNISSPSEMGWSEIQDIAKKRNLEIVVTPSSGYVPAKELFGNKVDYQYCTVRDWLDNIANSQLVITTSFHGVVFCLLFHTPFIYVPLHGGFSRGNNRITDLLNYLHVDGHVFDKEGEMEKLASSQFDWNHIEDRMKLFRDKSMSFLTESLENAKK